MSKTESKLPLGDTRANSYTRLFVSPVGGIPVVGPIIQATIQELIPNVRLERIEAYLLALQRQIEEVALEAALQTHWGLDTFEEGMWQTARAFTDERKAYVTNLVVRGLTSEETEKHKVRHTLRILGQIDDRQIILFSKFLPKNSPSVGDTEAAQFMDANRNLVSPGLSVKGIFDFDESVEAQEEIELSASMVGHLASLGLLEEDANFDNAGQPLNTKKFHINNFGKDFLTLIGAN